MTDTEKLNAEIAGHIDEIARLTAERDALEKPASDAERWARVFQYELRKKSTYWAEFDDFSERRKTDLAEVMQTVLDGIRAEWAHEKTCLSNARDILVNNLSRVAAERDAMREDLATLRRLYSEDSGSLSNKWAAAISERDALRVQVDALAVRSAGLEAERDSLVARVQKVEVAFDVTEEELEGAWMASGPEKWAPFCFRYLAEHATVVRPNTSRERWRAGGGGIFMSGDEWACAYAIIVTAHNAILDELERVEAERDEMTISAHMRELGFIEDPPGDLPTVEEFIGSLSWKELECCAAPGDPCSPSCSKVERFIVNHVIAHLRPWLRPKTITREQLDAAARVITTQRVVDENSTLADTARGIAQDVFAAIGITVEGENNG